MDNRQKILNLIGLATKARKTASGEFSTEKAVKSGKASLAVVDAGLAKAIVKQMNIIGGSEYESK